MTRIRSFALAAAITAAFASTLTLAQTAPAAGGAPAAAAPQGGGDGKGSARKGERGERFKKADTNNDGAISKAEADAAGMKGLSKNFDKLDANKDGKVTRDEMKAGREAGKGERKDGGKGEGKGGGLFKKADTNSDGTISKAEADAAGMKRVSANFDKIDANKDGKITQDEMKAARAAGKGKRGEGAAPAAPATK